MKQIQATGNLYGETITIKQVSKAAARKQFEAGNEVYLQSSNMRPFGVWQSICPIKKDNPYSWSANFESITNEYSYYNCDNERGKYVHFYIKAN